MNPNAERCADLRAGRQEPERTARNTATLSELPGDTMRSSRNQSALCAPFKSFRDDWTNTGARRQVQPVTSPGEISGHNFSNDSGSTEGRAAKTGKRADVRIVAEAQEHRAHPDSRNQARPAVTFSSAWRNKSRRTPTKGHGQPDAGGTGHVLQHVIAGSNPAALAQFPRPDWHSGETMASQNRDGRGD